MIRNIYGYKTFNHVVFARFLPGFISVHGCFCFVTRDVDFSVHAIFTHFSTMTFREHSYAIPDTTTVSLHLLCGTDFPDAVLFHITKMGQSPPTDTGEINFYTSRQDISSNSTTIIMVCFDIREFNSFFLGIMARYLDEEAEKEFIDISSTSDGQEQGATGGAPGGGNLPVPPHQPAVEVRMVPVEPGEPLKPQADFRSPIPTICGLFAGSLRSANRRCSHRRTHRPVSRTAN